MMGAHTRTSRAVRSGSRCVRIFVSALALVLTPTPAQADEGLEGRWSATPLRSIWNIGDWGPACGPRPSGGDEPSASVVVSSRGGELHFEGFGRPYSTRECWEQYPGLGPTSHSNGARSWRTVCKTPPGDSRQATVVTTITATDDRIAFDETGQYQFVIRGQNCTASVRRTRTFTRVPAEATPPSASSAPPPVQQPRCARVGLPERLEVRPKRKLMRPGETFTFRATVVDASGCPVKVAPVFRALERSAHVVVERGGRVRVAEDAPESEVRLRASVGDRWVDVLVEIASKERYEALLEKGEFDAQGESADAAVTRIASSSLGARSSVALDDTTPRRTRVVAIIGALSLASGLIGLWLVRRARKRAQRRAPVATAPLPEPKVESKPREGLPRVCPTCREEYPPGTRFCASDGNRLVDLVPATTFGPQGGICPVCEQGYDPGVATCPRDGEPLVPAAVFAQGRRRKRGVRKICPLCGVQFAPDSQFCGNCGAALVPVN